MWRLKSAIPLKTFHRITNYPGAASGLSKGASRRYHKIIGALKYFHFQVALQFPDHLLVDSVSVVTTLQQQNEDCKLYILGDTSYGRY